MDFVRIIGLIKRTIGFIPEAGFDSLIIDKGYMDSFIYMAALMLLSLPLRIIIELFSPMDPLAVIVTQAAGLVLALPFSYICILIMHLFLKLVGGKAEYLQTTQIFIYGDTASMLLSSIPIIGIIPALIGLANVVIGSARVHKISVWRAIFATLVLPVLLVVALGILLSLYLTPAAITASSLK